MKKVTICNARNVDGGYKVKCSKCGTTYWGLIKLTAVWRFNGHKRTSSLPVGGVKSTNPCQYATWSKV